MRKHKEMKFLANFELENQKEEPFTSRKCDIIQIGDPKMTP